MPRGIKCRFLDYDFDSQSEMQRAQYLYALEAEGVISNLILDKAQLSITVQPAYTIPANPFHKRVKVQAITYTPDFQYQFGGYTWHEDYKAERIVKKRDKKTGKIIKKKVVHVERDSRLRIKMLRPLLPAGHLFRVCFIATAAPDAKIGYVYK